MAYFNELPFIEYPSRFENQSSNEDYTLVRNIFRRAVIQSKIANSVTAFNYYQVRDDERPDQIADRIYGDPELDWIILITNNITNYPSQWPLNNNSLYEYLLNKYGSESSMNEINRFETIEVKDEYDRLVLPSKLQIDSDISQRFTTIANKDNPLFYEINSYPVSNEDSTLKVDINLSQYLEIWDRPSQIAEEYLGEIYNVSEIFLQESENPEIYNIESSIYPSYTKLDYSYLFIKGADGQTINIYIPVTLDGWPSTWGTKILIHNRSDLHDEITLKSSIGNKVDITDDSRLYSFSYLNIIDKFSYTDGTTIASEAGETYIVSDLTSNESGVKAKFEIKRNQKGEVITVKLIYGGRNYIPGEIITVNGSQVGGQDVIDDIQITAISTKPQPAFRFNSIGNNPYEPYPEVTVNILSKNIISYLNSAFSKVDIIPNQNSITNYEYELDLNESYRKILLLRPEYIGAFIGELKNIMSYDKSTERITKTIKRVYNSKLN